MDMALLMSPDTQRGWFQMMKDLALTKEAKTNS